MDVAVGAKTLEQIRDILINPTASAAEMFLFVSLDAGDGAVGRRRRRRLGDSDRSL